MKKLLIYCIIINMLMLSFSTIHLTASAEENRQNIFYVSPGGDDSNPGTEDKPWKTMWWAAEQLKPGQTAIFEDGVYEETNQSFFRHSGTADAPIIFKARNKHKAKLYYTAECEGTERLNIWSEHNEVNGVLTFEPKQYITIQDFEITQEQKRTDNTLDILVNVERAANCSIIGNKIHNAFEEGIKVYLSSNITLAGNEIYDTDHEGIDCFALAGGKIYNNTVSEFGRDGYMIKGNTANTLVYGNMAINKTRTANNGFDIGGSSNAQSPISTDEGSYEIYNSVFANNVVYAQDIEGSSSIETAFAFLGAKDCYCINNTIAGTEYGVYFKVPDNDWNFHPNNVNPVVKNNIMANVTYAYNDNNRNGNPEPQNVVRDYNLFYNCDDLTAYPISAEEHSIVANEDAFVNYGTDWHILKNSAAVGAGDIIPSEISAFAGFTGEGLNKNFPVYEYDPSRKLDLSLIGFSGAEPADIGALGLSDKDRDYEVNNLEFDGNGALTSAVIFRRGGEYSSFYVITALFEGDDFVATNIDYISNIDINNGVKLPLDLENADDNNIRVFMFSHINTLMPIENVYER